MNAGLEAEKTEAGRVRQSDTYIRNERRRTHTDDETSARGEDDDMFREDFGRIKMDVFKQQCRNILGIAEKSEEQYYAQKASQALAESSLGQSQCSQQATEALDIVTAYKTLKHAMSKNLRGIEKGREVCAGKGYLKPTVASRQAKRVTLGYAPLTLSTQHMNDSQLPAIRGSTAPAGAQRPRFTAEVTKRGIATSYGQKFDGGSSGKINYY